MENENVSFQDINSLVDNFANEYYQRHGHLPMFYIVERFLKKELSSNRLIESANAMYSLFSDSSCYCKIQTVAHNLNLSKERVRQLGRKFILYVLKQDYSYCPNPAMMKTLFTNVNYWKYIVKKSVKHKALSKLYVREILQDENTELNEDFAIIVLASLLRNHFKLIGTSPFIKTKRTNNYWKNLYLINNDVASIFDFDKFIEMAYYYEYGSDAYILCRIDEYAEKYFKNAWNIEKYIPYVQDVSPIIGAMFINELNKKVDVNNRIALRGKRKLIEDVIYDILSKSKGSMSVDDLFNYVNFIFCDKIKKKASILQAVRTDNRLFISNKMVSKK